jgi:SAM-dependent methyltransferase
MHPQAYRWLGDTMASLPAPARVLELGSRDINGTPRPLVNGAVYQGVDSREGNGVDIVADAATFTPEAPADVVLCCEVLEHAEDAQAIVVNAVRCAKPGGHVLITCATNGRRAHSGWDGGALRDGEHYRNIDADQLKMWLVEAGAEIKELTLQPSLGDLYVLAVKPEPIVTPKPRKRAKR